MPELRRHYPGERALLDIDRAGVGEGTCRCRCRLPPETVNVPALLNATAEPSPVEDQFRPRPTDREAGARQVVDRGTGQVERVRVTRACQVAAPWLFSVVPRDQGWHWSSHRSTAHRKRSPCRWCSSVLPCSSVSSPVTTKLSVPAQGAASTSAPPVVKVTGPPEAGAKLTVPRRRPASCPG